MGSIPNIVYILIFVYFVFFRKRSSDADSTGDGSVDAIELQKHYESNDEVKKMESAGLTRSYSFQTYQNMADKLKTAMEGIGTDETEVLKIMFMVKNDLDFKLLFDAFGDDDGNLKEWLRGDLSDYYINKINTNYKSKGMLKRV